MAKKKEPMKLMRAKPKATFSKILTSHVTSTFHKYRLEKKLLQEKGEKMDMIISNAAYLKISLFIKSIWE